MDPRYPYIHTYLPVDTLSLELNEVYPWSVSFKAFVVDEVNPLGDLELIAIVGGSGN